MPSYDFSKKQNLNGYEALKQWECYFEILERKVNCESSYSKRKTKR